jgi:glycyl-tRNA synthetase beta chain
MPDLLLEIGLEEIPARMIDSARDELVTRIRELLTRERLLDNVDAASFKGYSTPRRLAVLVRGVVSAQADVEEQVTGPSLKAAYKDGVPTPAAEAFARKVGVSVDKLATLRTAKGDYLSAVVRKSGKTATSVLAEFVPKEIGAIYWAKNMNWRGKAAEKFVRPVRWLVAELDGQIIPCAFAGTRAGNVSRGHRILAKKDVTVAPGNYERALVDAGVIADPAERRAKIQQGIAAALQSISGSRWRKDDDLLATVVNLTEFPSVIVGAFDREFLSLPEEILVTVMRDHQKYFAVEDAQGKLLPHFLAVLNTGGDPDGLIQHGNERVLRARFNDAVFFWRTDQKVNLQDRVEMLKSVTFQKDLGSYYEKAKRLSYLVNIGGADFDRRDRKVNRNALHLAAWIAKTDLTTELVKEFTELQGIVGGLYAKAQGLDSAVADAVYDQYKPASMEDAVPRSLEGALLAIADKADTIAGMFALGLQPTGSRDPFALRRQANGIVKIVAEHKLPLDLRMLFDVALAAYKGTDAEKKFSHRDQYAAAIRDFFRERLEFYLRDVKGFAYDEVSAVLAADAMHVSDAVERAAAVAAVRGSADFGPISAAFKRIKNILRQAADMKIVVPAVFDPGLAQAGIESELARMAEAITPRVQELRKHHQYREALKEVAQLGPVLDTFFEKVMVMVEDERLRGNRLALLSRLLKDFSTIADFSEIVVRPPQSETPDPLKQR